MNRPVFHRLLVRRIDFERAAMEYVDATQLIIGHTFGHHHKLRIYGRHLIPYLRDEVKPVPLNDNRRHGMAVVRRITEHRRPCGTLVDADGKVFLWVSEKVKELYSRGIKIFLVSSESEVKVNETARKNLGGVEFAKVYSGVSRSDVEAYSSILSEIVKSLGVTGREVTHLGDDERGVLACKKAGVIPAGVTWGELDARQMLIAGASYVLSDGEDLALCMDFL